MDADEVAALFQKFKVLADGFVRHAEAGRDLDGAEGTVQLKRFQDAAVAFDGEHGDLRIFVLLGKSLFPP